MASGSSGDGSSRNAIISLQVNNVDSYQNPPLRFDKSVYADVRSTINLPQVPVIRMFGTTRDGYNAMVHVHGVFPYFYIRYKGGLNPDEGLYSTIFAQWS
jgi:DNA polymerase zeta